MKFDPPSSPTFCPAPWSQVALTIQKELRACCSMEGFHTTWNNLSEYWNSEELQKIRSTMLNGQWPSACSACQLTEQNGGVSKRFYERYLFDTILESDTSISIDVNSYVKTGPFMAEIRFGNLCNLKCRMCDSFSSSSVAAEYRTLENKDFFPDAEVNRSGYDELKKYLPPLKSLRLIRLLGGEPFIDPECFKFCHALVEEGHSSNIHLIFTTNMTTFSDEWVDLLSQFKKITLHISLDGIGPVVEYIRSGTCWKRLDENIHKALSKIPTARIVFVPCMQIYNILNLFEVMNYVHKLKINNPNIEMAIFPNVLREPIYLSAELVPINLKKEYSKLILSEIENTWTWLTAEEIQRLKGLIHEVYEQVNEDRERLKQWKYFTEILDKKRGEKLADINEELGLFLTSID